MEASKSCQDSSATSLLTKNQKKKRRQKLSKLGKQDPSAGSDASCMSAVSVLSSRHFRQAAAVPAHLQPSKLHNLADLEPSREQSSAAPSAGQQSAAAAVQDREPGDTAELASSCCTAQTWLGSQDCSTQAACIAAALVSRSDPAAGPAEDPEPSAAGPVLGSKRTRTVSEHGNYRRYYGYRLGGAPDPRLQVLQKQWFCNKRCLDIGCNAGAVAIAIARMFHTQTVLGIDIDSSLVQHACRQLSMARTDLHHELRDRSWRLTNQQRKAGNAAAASLGGVWFQQQDFVACEHEPQSMDTILCLSVTKWVHLHGGDAALQALFAEVGRMLVPGGIFVLEPQPWRSYKQAERKLEGSSTKVHSLSSLQLRPEGFTQLLESSHGLQLLREFSPQHQHQGFSRPVLVFKRQIAQAIQHQQRPQLEHYLYPEGELSPSR